LLIVPDRDVLSVEAKVAPSDVDQLYPDQPSILRFSGFTGHHGGAAHGHVVLHVAHRGMRNFAKLKSLKVIPGMPVEAFIQTGARSALSYFLKPLADQIERTFLAS
jgi:HlyD family secretion protein